MDDIHYDSYSKTMGLVHEGLELLRRTEARAEGEEVRDLIAERSVVRMLLKGHDLECVISQVSYLRKHVDTELFESSHLLLLCSHTDVALIDQRVLALAGSFILPLIRSRIPDLCAESLRNLVLDSSCGVGRNSFSTAALPLDVELIEHSVLEEHCRKHDFPGSAPERPQSIGFSSLPVVELAYQIYLCSVRSPLAEDPVALVVAVHSVVHMVVHSLAQGSVDRHPLLEVHDHLMPSVDDVLVWHQPLIVVINHILLHLCTHIQLF